jgi:hypothetical protein
VIYAGNKAAVAHEPESVMRQIGKPLVPFPRDSDGLSYRKIGSASGCTSN